MVVGAGARGGRWLAVLAALAVVVGCAAPFDPDGDAASAAREEAEPQVQAVVGELTAGVAPLATARADGCRTGQHNWKVKDRYAHECQLVAAALVPAAATEEDVSAALVAMGDRLDGLGCTTTWYPLRQVATDYWETLHGRPDYGPGSLPAVGYECSDVSVWLDPLDPSATPDRLSLSLWLDDVLDEQPFPDDTAGRLDVEGSAMFWLVTARKTYYAVEF